MISKNFEGSSLQSFCKKNSYHSLGRTIFDHHLSFFDYVFCEGIPDRNMPGITCTRVSDFFFHIDCNLIVLKDYVIQYGISLVLQKHDQMYVVWKLITYPHYFRLCRYLVFIFCFTYQQCSMPRLNNIAPHVWIFISG